MASFDVGGLDELVRAGTTGTLAPAGDVAGLASDITALIREPGRLAAMRAGCRALVEAEHPLELAAARHVELYEKLVA